MAAIKSERRLIIVSNRLPFSVSIKNGKTEVKESDGGLVSALKSYFDKGTLAFASTLWIGAADFIEKVWSKIKDNDPPYIACEVEPLFIEKKTYNKYYNGFCNATLWPLFHYVPSFVEFEKTTFDCYEEVNRLFADKVLSLIRPGDIVWVHDYQLMLLPGMIREKVPGATIGFFLHIPFPSYEIFRMLHRPWKEKIVNGLLGTDVVGFHTHEYVQHFLKTVQMISGYDHQYRNIFTPTRVVKTEMFPMGIDFERFNSALTLPEVIEASDAIKANFAGKKIIFSVDRLDYTKGITHRIQGFERFLELNPEWKERVVFIQVVVPSRQAVSKYTERKKLIEEEIGRTNGKYSNLSWQPIIYRYNQLSFVELTSLYNAADVGLITPLRDGMNLVAKEFAACKSNEGVLILSELAGASTEMGEAILVNPMDKDDTAQAILQALSMPAEIQKQKISQLHQRLRQYSVVQWMNDFLHQLEETKALQHAQSTKFLSGKTASKMISDFKHAGSRLILLDYDGTLVPYSREPSKASPDRDLITLLRALSSDDRNDVTIISGRTSESLENWFASLPVTLVAEHGAGIRGRTGAWTYNADTDQSWKDILRPILDLYCQRSPGAFVEDKKHTLVWHYRTVDPELGFIRSRGLLDNLHHMTRNSHLNIIDGNKVIEIRIAGIDKGAITKKLLASKHYAFVMAMGDDKTDEDMFKVLSGTGYTIKIGADHTLAKYHLPDQAEAVKLLKILADIPVMSTAPST